MYEPKRTKRNAAQTLTPQTLTRSCGQGALMKVKAVQAYFFVHIKKLVIFFHYYFLFLFCWLSKALNIVKRNSWLSSLLLSWSLLLLSLLLVLLLLLLIMNALFRCKNDLYSQPLSRIFPLFSRSLSSFPFLPLPFPSSQHLTIFYSRHLDG